MKFKDLAKVVDSDTLIIFYVNYNFELPAGIGYIRELHDSIKFYGEYEVIQISAEKSPDYCDYYLRILLRNS